MGQPNLHRGQAPAKGILHIEQRTPVKTVTGDDGVAVEHSDPRGYWHGQHTNPARNKKRQAVAAAGGARQLKKIVRQLRG